VNSNTVCLHYVALDALLLVFFIFRSSKGHQRKKAGSGRPRGLYRFSLKHFASLFCFLIKCCRSFELLRGPDFVFFNKDPYLLSFLGGQILSSPTRILCPLSFLGGQSLSSSIRIPCLLSFLGSQIFVSLRIPCLWRFLGGQTLSIPCILKLLGGLDNFIAVQVTWLPLNSLIVTDFVHFFQLQPNVYSIIPKHFYIACVCICLSTSFCVMKLQ
jgi:hypothetical protein